MGNFFIQRLQTFFILVTILRFLNVIIIIFNVSTPVIYSTPLKKLNETTGCGILLGRYHELLHQVTPT